LPAADGLHAELDAAGEQDLHPDADPQHRAPSSHPFGDDLLAAHRVQPGHARRERADTGNHQSIGSSRRVGVGGHLDRGPGPLQGALG
jgi:hypothetical protein